jgi:putative DNA primase/helicase
VRVTELTSSNTQPRDPLQDFTGESIAQLLNILPREPEPEANAEPQESWPEPEPLGSELPPVPAFDPELLPESLRDYCIDVADRMQVPLDLPAVGAVAAIGASVMRRAEIQPKENDTSWTEYPNLWGAIVAPPGMMKSPVIDAATASLRNMESLWRVQYESELAESKANKKLAELKTRAWEQQYVAASKRKDVVLPIQPDDSAPEPHQKRLITSDATFESLHQILAHNPAGIACWRDEMTGWLASLERQGRESERAFFLEGWSGHSGFTIDRIGRGSIHVEYCCLSVFGGIQPARLRSYLTDVLKDGPSNDGLIQRFQLLVWPDFDSKWIWVDRQPNMAAQRRAESVYRRLLELDADNPLRLKFDSNAQQMFIAWLTALETKIRSDETPPVLQAHLAKYRKLMPALSLLFALADGHTEVVPLESAKRAAAWCEYLEPHARRVYASKLAPEQAAAQALSRRLKAGWHKLDRSFTVRDVYRPQWAGLTTPDEARAALRVLCEHGWIRKTEPPSDGSGRPSETYVINPRIEEVK